jgi:hypothetical protein
MATDRSPAPDGAPLFPIDPALYDDEPVGLLAGDPGGHREILADITGGML